ncbi:amphi-Trp domain-containing protein [Kitasatospora aburaviensis]
MKDLKFEQKRSLSRLEAADQLEALAAALRHGGNAELDLGPGTMTLRVPEELKTEIEVEVGEGRSSWRSSSSGPPRRARRPPAATEADPAARSSAPRPECRGPGCGRRSGASTKERR